VITALVDCLALFYQSGNLAQVEVIARNMLAAIPDDIVALQFLGLALYQTGRFDDAYRTFSNVNFIEDLYAGSDSPSVCEPARIAILRAATRVNSGLADAWFRIALVLRKLGFQRPAMLALDAAAAAGGEPLVVPPGTDRHA